MTSPDISPTKLPYHLMPNTVQNLPVESPRYVDPEYVYLRQDTGELFLDAREVLDASTKNPTTLLGKVGLMKVAIMTPVDKTLITGYVADLRFLPSTDDFDVAPPAEPPSDQEEFDMWQEDTNDMIPVAAIAFKGIESTTDIETAGDERFYRAVLHLASLADELDAKLKQKNTGAPARPTRSRKRSKM